MTQCSEAPFYKLSLKYLNSMRPVVVQLKGTGSGGLEMAVLLLTASSFFQLALAVRSELRKQFGNEQPIDGHKNHFQKNPFPFVIAIVGFAPVGALQ